MKNRETVQKLSECFDMQAKAAPFSGVVLLEKEGETFFRATGYADSEGRRLIGRDTRFRHASVTKIITRAAIARLADEGRLSLDDPIGTYVQGLPAVMGAITVDQILQHKSGIVSLTRPSDEDFMQLMAAKRAADLLPLLIKHPLEYDPGEGEAYSNGGFVMLGIVIEAITGKTYGEYLEEGVFRPLQMKSASLEVDAQTAVPMTKRDSSELQRAAFQNQVGLPSGGSVSNADDLMKLARALRGDRFISSPVKMRVFPENENGELGQFGGTDGVNTIFALYPRIGWTTVILANYDPPAAELMEAAMWSVMNGRACATMTEEEWLKQRQ